MAKTKKSRIYFTQDTENAIIEYIKETDENVRNNTFKHRIYAPFLKLTEIIINKGSFSYGFN